MAEKVRYQDIRPMSLREVVERSRTLYGGHLAFQLYEKGISRSYSYEEVATIVRNVGAALMDAGVGKGERVGLLSKNRPEWGLAYFAIVSIGAVVVPLDVDLKLDELLVFLNHAEARELLVSRNLLEGIQASRTKLPFLRNIVVLDGEGLGSDVLSFDQLNRQGTELAEGHPSRAIGLDDLATILYAAGASGPPRGVMLSHRNLVFDSLACLQVTPYKPDDRFLSLVPLYHAYEFIGGFLSPFIAGSSITYTTTMRPHKLLRIMQEVRVTKMVGVPLLFTMFYDVIWDGLKRKGICARKTFTAKLTVARVLQTFVGIKVGKWLFRGVHKDFGDCIRYLLCGGAAPDMDVLEFFDLLGIKITQGYGLTEASPVLAVNPPTRNKLRSVGVPLPGIEIDILNANLDGMGEIVARGPNIMQGYYRDPETTQQVLHDGCLRTGDLGYLDEDGYLYFCGRCKSLIVLQSGKNVYPGNVERVYLQSPTIREICVVPSEPFSSRKGDTKGLFGIIVPDLDGILEAVKQGDPFSASLPLCPSVLLRAENIHEEGDVRSIIQEEVKRLSKEMVYYRRIKDFELWGESLPKLADGILNRQAIFERWRHEQSVKTSAKS